MTWSESPMAAFDTETTGIDVETDRIVTACVAVVNAPTPYLPCRWLINPGIDIPEGATAVHGITTEHAREHGAGPVEALAVIRAELVDSWDMGFPVVAFNAAYDLTILDRELRRYGLPPLDSHGLVIDPLVLDRHVDKFRRGSRKLDATCAHYRVALDGAHDATHDALAAARVAWRILSSNPELDGMDADDLYALQVEAHAAWAEGFEAHLRSQGKGDVIDRAWPMRYAAVAS